jgi:hypothetical protein
MEVSEKRCLLGRPAESKKRIQTSGSRLLSRYLTDIQANVTALPKTARSSQTPYSQYVGYRTKYLLMGNTRVISSSRIPCARSGPPFFSSAGEERPESLVLSGSCLGYRYHTDRAYKTPVRGVELFSFARRRSLKFASDKRAAELSEALGYTGTRQQERATVPGSLSTSTW